MKKKLIIPFICVGLFGLMGCNSPSPEPTEEAVVLEESGSIDTYTDEPVAIDFFFDHGEEVTLDGPGSIEDYVYTPVGEGTVTLTSGNKTLEIIIKDPSTRVKDRFYYAGDITDENGKKVFTTTDGTKYVGDFYAETERGVIDFTDYTHNIKDIQFVAGTQYVYEELEPTKYQFSRGDAVFRIMLNDGIEKTFIVHSWCDCGD